MSSELVVIINAVLYTLALCVFLLKYKVSVGAVIWLLYTVSAWATVLFIQQPMYYTQGVHASEQTIFPYVYLFIINLVAIFPLVKLRNIPHIRFSGERLICVIMVACCAIQLLFFVVDMPYMIEILTSPADVLASIRDSGYAGEAMSLVQSNVWTNRLELLFSGMRLLATGLSVYLLLAYKKHRKLVVSFFALTLINNIRMIIISVGRGEVVLLFMLYACMFYSLRHMITKKVYLKLLIIAIPVFIIGISFFWTITIARFGEFAEYTLYKYIGEPMNNFNGLLFNEIEGTTNGRAYFSLFYRYVLGQEEIITTTEKWSMINKVTGIDGSLFYTWVGGLIIEFGKIVPLIVAVLLNRMMNRLSTLKEYRIGDLLVVIFFANFYLRGVFHFPIQNFDGMFMILYTFVLYILFRVQKNKEQRWVYVLPQKPKSF